MGRLLCIDYGEKRIGLAISDEMQIIATPLDVLKNDGSLMENLKKLIDYYHFEKIIIGIPEFDRPTTSIEKVKEFGEKLKTNFKIEVEYFNEAYTTVYAEYFLRSIKTNRKKIKEKIDKYAACKILSDYLEKLSHKSV